MLTSDEDNPPTSGSVPVPVPVPDRAVRVSASPVRRGIGLTVQEAVVRLETILTRILEYLSPRPSHHIGRPLIGGRCLPIEDPVWESFAEYRREHREEVARREEEQQRREEEEKAEGEKENVER